MLKIIGPIVLFGGFKEKKMEEFYEKKEWIEITKEFKDISSEMKDSEIISEKDFSLLEIMSALEVNSKILT
jgi:hypothetical protein